MKCEHEDCGYAERIWISVDNETANTVKHLISKTTISRKENSQ